MIDAIKDRIWGFFKDNEVSLVMLYHRDGSILWHRGRKIEGNSVIEGNGFCKTYINESFQERNQIYKKNGVIFSSSTALSGSALRLLVKSVYIQPLDNGFFLYIDSGTKTGFPEEELYSIKILGELLGETIKQIKVSENEDGGIAGVSASSSDVKDLVLKYSLEDIPILLLGETGVGKNHVSELIHKYSGRKGKFVTAHLPTIQENLFESEMFGYKKGAFTGAISDKKGLIDEAAGGTLFLDEISEVPVSLQAKLLRLIETQKYNRVGDSKESIADIRIIAASNRNIRKEIEKGLFREDLYYRLSILEIKIQPLRERKEDILELFKEKKKLLRKKKTGEGFMDVLKNHSWPGNVREFITVLTRVGILCNEPVTGADLKNIINNDWTIDDECKHHNILDKKLQKIVKKIRSGDSFWYAVKIPFLDRVLNKDEVIKIVSVFLEEKSGIYSEILEPLNLKKGEYKKFIRFLYNNDLKPEI